MEIRTYDVKSHLFFCSSDYGVPQNREQVVFIGSGMTKRLLKRFLPPSVIARK